MRTIFRILILVGTLLTFGSRLLAQSDDEVSSYSGQFYVVDSERVLRLALESGGHKEKTDNVGISS